MVIWKRCKIDNSLAGLRKIEDSKIKSNRDYVATSILEIKNNKDYYKKNYMPSCITTSYG